MPGDVVDFGGWVYLQSGGGSAVDWILYALDANHNLIAAVVPTPWSVTTTGVWTYEVGSYTVPSNIAYVTLLAQVYQPSGATTVRFDDGFLIAGTHYLHSDHLSTRVVTSANGSVVGQQGHYPFGESWYAQNTTTNWKFTSYQRDTESGNDYALMRSYVNRLARFSSPDPAGLAAADPSNPQSWNRYAYVLNSPLAFDDPTGLDPCQGANAFWFSQAANGTGIFDEQDCNANGGSWSGGPVSSSGGGGGGLGNGFLNGPGGGDPGNGPPGNPTPGCTPIFDSDDNFSGLNCPPTGSSGGAVAGGSTPSISAKGGFYHGNPTIIDINGKNCTPSVLDPSCQQPSCPAVFFKGIEDADLGLPYNADEAARTAAAAAVTQHIVSRGLVKPLSSSIVRNFFAAGEFAGTVLAYGPILYQEVVGLAHEVKAWNSGKCTTIWSKP